MFGKCPHFIYYNGSMYAKVAITGWKNHLHTYVDVYQGTFSGPGSKQLAPNKSAGSVI